MSRLDTVERIEKTLFSVGNLFSVKNVILNGNKGKNDNKLNSIYTRSYDSQKYSDRSTLDQIQIRTSDFLVFSYHDFQNKINEDIFISYPHMMNFMTILTSAYNMVNTDEVYQGNNINPKYANVSLTTNPLGGGKQLAFIPTIIQRDQVYTNGVILFLGSEDYAIELDASQLGALYYILNNFNLLSESSTLFLTGLMFDSAVEGSEPSVNTFSSAPKNNAGFNAKPKRGIFGGNNGASRGSGNTFGGNNSEESSPKRNAGFKPQTKNVTPDELESAIENGTDLNPPIPNDDDIPFTGGIEDDSPIETGGENSDSPISFNDVMAGATEIEVPDLDDKDGGINF
ncbi:hypothetical protein DA469_21340 [Bacillus subtilis]|nr:hypothetical protein DA469_21340 [Bacillus subtilis]